MTTDETRIDIKSSPSFVKGVKLLNLEHFKKHFGCCPGVQKYTIYDFATIYSTIRNLSTLDTYQKNILLVRFNRICTFIKNKYTYVRFYYTASKIYVIITGIINPALLSINVQSDTFWYEYVYWLVWILQIMVSLVTALSSFYKWDKKYFTYKAYKMKIEQELWLYLELIDRYSRINQKCKREKTLGYTTHETKINLFLYRLEYLFKKLKDADLDIEITEDESSRSDTSNVINNNNKKYPPTATGERGGFSDEIDRADGSVPQSLFSASNTGEEKQKSSLASSSAKKIQQLWKKLKGKKQVEIKEPSGDDVEEEVLEGKIDE